MILIMELNEAEIKALSSFKNSVWWSVIKKEIEERIKNIDEQFINEFNSLWVNDVIRLLDWDSKTNKVIWLNRYQKAILEWFLDLPEELINSNVIVTDTNI